MIVPAPLKLNPPIKSEPVNVGPVVRTIDGVLVNPLASQLGSHKRWLKVTDTALLIPALVKTKVSCGNGKFARDGVPVDVSA